MLVKIIVSNFCRVTMMAKTPGEAVDVANQDLTKKYVALENYAMLVNTKYCSKFKVTFAITLTICHTLQFPSVVTSDFFIFSQDFGSWCWTCDKQLENACTGKEHCLKTEAGECYVSMR